MNDEMALASVAFTVYALSSVRRMNRMPAALRLDGADFGLRIPIRLGTARYYLPNPLRPDTCLIDRPRSAAEIVLLRNLARDLIPFQIASLLSAAIVWLAMPVMAARMPMLPVLVATFFASAVVVVGAFVVSWIDRGNRLDRTDVLRLATAAIISPPVAANLARDVARASRCRS